MIGRKEQTEELRALRQEVAQLRRAVASHALVDQAIGVVVAVGGLSAAQGWTAVRYVSQHTNTKLRDVARCLVRWPLSGELPEDIRRTLSAAVDHARTLPADAGAGVEARGGEPGVRQEAVAACGCAAAEPRCCSPAGLPAS
ncbi:hypothetical protein GCM10018785_69500 [Streptomyces longispororuber]|uniref:ANTAR domain-containing protein n=1 Tax=Streptomyces longispororuber TaxID=68230 RepID=A0A919A9W8_9ACTN|nr:ANTAR domain-containing protein [Streptomyces longispororuber]GHE93887.1 hypothetical protein GCM10018785_69500 [Streptomyces longispororuber]